MCKLVPLLLPNGKTVNVAEHKKDKLTHYIELFPEMPGIMSVRLFGSTLEERCRDSSDIDLCLLYKGDRRVYLDYLDWIWDRFPDSVYDDIIGFPYTDFGDSKRMSGAMWDVWRKGVEIYDSN